MNKKQWCNKSSYGTGDETVIALAKELNVTPVTALLLVNRGITDKKSEEMFLSLSENYMYDPFLLCDMDKAVERILKAVGNKEKTVIYGDYDVDGVTSVSILYKYLEELGNRPTYHVPSRTKEGYGVNNEAIDKFKEEGITLIITVDTGITAVEEAKYAASLGIDMVITDHHECQDVIPDAAAVVNPKRRDSKYPFTELAGVGVVFKLISAIEMRLYQMRGDNGNYLSGVTKKYMDLVAIGTVADVMPLVDENRLFVSLGLSVMKNNMRPALEMLLESAQSSQGSSERKIAVSSSTVSYTLAPRINAAGRMESAETAVELFLSDDKERAHSLAVQLCEINRRRQEEENIIVNSAIKKIGRITDDDKIIVLSENDWSSGIIGIVASRITERFGVPSILISFEGDIGKGSGRSISGINLVEALGSCSDLLIKYGGHSLAAGLSIERGNLESFTKRINEYIKAQTEGKCLVPTIEYETELSSAEVSVNQATQQMMLEPFGVSNPLPIYMISSVRIADIMELGGGKHTKILVRKDGILHTALLFGVPRITLDFVIGDEVDLLFNMTVNEFRSNVNVQMIVKDIRLCNDTVTKQERQRYREITEGGVFYRDENFLPSRDDIAMIYLYIKRKTGQTRDDYIVIREMIQSTAGRMNYVKVRIIVAILIEMGLVNAQSADEYGDVYRFAVNYVKNKVDIEKSPLYVKLKGAMQKR